MTAMRLHRYPSPSGGIALGKTGVGATMLRTLPYKRQLGYLLTDGSGPYIDFGFSINATMTVKANIGTVGGLKAGGYVFASRIANTASGYFGFRYELLYSTTSVRWYGRNRTLDIQMRNQYVPDFLEYATVEITPTQYKLDAIVEDSKRNSVSGAENFKYGRGRMCWIEFSDNRTMFMRCIPVMTNDDVPAMYDEIGGNFLYNAGTGTFSYGELSGLPDIPSSI